MPAQEKKNIAEEVLAAWGDFDYFASILTARN